LPAHIEHDNYYLQIIIDKYFSDDILCMIILLINQREADMKKWLTIISAASIILLSSMSSFAAIVNGGFEDVSIDGTSLPGWQGGSDFYYGGVPITAFAWIADSNSGWPLQAVEGTHYLLLNNGVVFPTTWVYQDIYMNAGEILSGYAAFNGLNDTDGTGWASVSVNSKQVWFGEDQAAGWSKWHWTAPQNGQYRLQLTLYDSNGTGSFYPSFDGISLSSVPLPGAIWLLGTGLLGLVGIRKRSA
jgi:hypothetical protein